MKNQLTQMLGLPSGVTALQAVCSSWHTVVIGTDGHCYATGLNNHGQLGTGDNLHKNQLTQMLGLPSGVTAFQVVCGDDMTVVIGTDGHCYATGSNSHGQLGTGNNLHKNQLTQMLGLPSGVTALQAVCSSWHTVVIGTDGHCYATGSNSHGQLGTGNNPHKNQLTQMLGLPVSDEVKTLASMAATFILSLGLKKVMQKIIESHYNPRVIDLLTEQLPAHLLYCNRCCQIKPSFSQKVIMKRKGTRAGIVRVFASETEYCLGCAIWK